MSDEALYQFVDTNILVYAHDRSAGAKHERAKELIQELWDTQTGCLSVQVLQELYVTLTQKIPNPPDEGTILRIITDLSYWKIHAPVADDVLSAITLGRRYGISFWDAMILWSAAELECQVVWSEDLNPGQPYADVRVMNPFHRSAQG